MPCALGVGGIMLPYCLHVCTVRRGESPGPRLAMESMEALPLQWTQAAEMGVGESSPSCFENTVKTHTDVPT
eukprot:1349901-Prorocentrum_lima.AAC.1